MRAFFIALCASAAVLRTRPGGDEPDDEPEDLGGSTCEATVMKVLDSAEFRAIPRPKEPIDLGARIGMVIGDATYWDGYPSEWADCCHETEYAEWSAAHDAKKERLDLDWTTTAVLVIDVQQDFTSGTFAQPCQDQVDEMIFEIEELVEGAAREGAYIVASKDLHPADHCSFAAHGQCSNKHAYEMANGRAKGTRYANEFPSHCSFEVKDGKAVPQPGNSTPFCQFMKSVKPADVYKTLPFCQQTWRGADFHPRIAQKLADVSEAHDRVDVVFKGFHPDYDSFSAFPHPLEGDADEELSATGSFGLPAADAAKCRGKWNEDQCYPTIDEATKLVQGGRSLSSMLADKGIRTVVVVGLVFDFCVKETAMFAKDAVASLEHTYIVRDLTLPAFNGRPGSPYAKEFCALQESDGDFCSSGGGTKPHFDHVLTDLANHYQSEKFQLVGLERIKPKAVEAVEHEAEPKVESHGHKSLAETDDDFSGGDRASVERMVLSFEKWASVVG